MRECSICNLPIEEDEVYYCIEAEEQLNICVECINNCKKKVGKSIEEEKYYICENCGYLTTQTEILQEVEQLGGTGMCCCEFTNWFWNDEHECLDVETTREFKDYTEINRPVYYLLKEENNEVLRLKKFSQIPKKKRLRNDRMDFSNVPLKKNRLL